MSTHPLPLAVLMFVVGLAADMCQPAHADGWTEHEVTLARICVNEASFRDSDCRAIVEARGRYDVATLRRMHPRALASHRTDARPWIAHLGATSEMPAGWPEDRVSWHERGLPAWTRILSTVRDTMRTGGACEARPHVWGGRTLDAERISRLEARGYVRVDCGSTSNVYLRRVP